jgi:hypothetical protein
MGRAVHTAGVALEAARGSLPLGPRQHLDSRCWVFRATAWPCFGMQPAVATQLHSRFGSLSLSRSRCQGGTHVAGSAKLAAGKAAATEVAAKAAAGMEAVMEEEAREGVVAAAAAAVAEEAVMALD